MPATHPLNVRATEASERILKDTGGQVQINIFPNNQLGKDADMLSQLRAGGLEFFAVSGVNVLSRSWCRSRRCGAWANDDAVHKALDGELGKFLRGQFPKVGLPAATRSAAAPHRGSRFPACGWPGSRHTLPAHFHTAVALPCR